MLTPDNLTTDEYRKRGYHITKVEGWGMYPDIHRKDFLGIFDYLAWNDTCDDIFAIQTTTKTNMSARRKKMLHAKSFSWWCGRPVRRAILHGWYKKSGRWVVQEEELTIQDWQAYQEEEQKKYSQVDTNSELYKSLFPNGHAAQCVPSAVQTV